ncbi:MAG: MFS transporter [Actinomycetota bacterium]
MPETPRTGADSADETVTSPVDEQRVTGNGSPDGGETADGQGGRETEAGDDESTPRVSPTGALRIVAFRQLWGNNIAYFMTVNAIRFVFGWYVLDGLQRGEREQGLVVFALGIPAVFLVLQAGVWADRLDPRRLLIATQVAALSVLALTATLIAIDQAPLPTMLVLAALAGAATTIGQPVRAALIPALAGRENLFGAIALNALAMTISMIIGPVLAQAFGNAFGFDGAVWFLVGLLVIGLVIVWPLRVPPREEPLGPRRSLVVDTVEAVGHVVRDPALRILFGLLTMSGLTVNPLVMVTLQAFVKEELGRNSGDAAPLLAVMGVGIAISSVVVMRKGDMANKGAAFQRAMMVGSTMVFLMGRTDEYWQLFPLTLGMGLAGGFYINMNQGLIQANTPQALMGRVMGLFTLVQVGLMPIGALALGLIASTIGIGLTMSVTAALALAVVVTTYVSSPELRRLR